jgi:DNA-binding response OmpR family regulator
VRTLLVEDEVRLASYLKRGLEREGFAVDVAGDGQEGLWMATNHPYDAIVLDIMLPKLNGYQVCIEIRKRGIWAPVLMLTAKDGDLDEAEALDSGADDFVTKPFSFVVLLARLRALARRGSNPRPALLQVGDVKLDPAEHRVHIGTEEVVLTPTEFSVLEVLMRQPGQVVAKAAILDSCWDWAFEGDPNIVEVYVHHLRRKLAASNQTKVRTVRGVGYRLEVDDS